MDINAIRAALTEIGDHLGAAQALRLPTDDSGIAAHVDTARDHARAVLALLAGA